MLDSLISDLLEGLMAAATSGDRIPGSSVTPRKLKEALNLTSQLSRRLSRLSALHAEALRKLIPDELTVAPVSEGLKGIDTKAIMAALSAIKDGAATLAAQFPARAKELEVIQADVDHVLQAWQSIVEVDLANEEVEFDLNVNLRGPKWKIERVKAAVTRAADDAILKELLVFRVGIAPCGHLVVLDPQEPQHIDCISITGDALKQRVQELGGTLATEAEVREFIDTVKKSADVSDDTEEDVDDLEEDGEIELDEEEDEVGSSPLV